MNPVINRLKPWMSLALVLMAPVSCHKAPPAQLAYQVVSSRPHDGDAYTQGFQISDGRLFESTGQYGESSLRELETASGKILRKRPLAKQVFGEGLTLLQKELWVLTWKENTVYVFEPETFKLIRSHTYKGEGWGLTSDGTQLIMSDGSSELKFINPKDFSVGKTLEVTDRGRPVNQLNELEYAGGQIFANIYTTGMIARISPEDGRVTGWLDLSALRRQLSPPGKAEVLNGIAILAQPPAGMPAPSAAAPAAASAAVPAAETAASPLAPCARARDGADTARPAATVENSTTDADSAAFNAGKAAWSAATAPRQLILKSLRKSSAVNR